MHDLSHIKNPSPDELASLERELQFCEVVNNCPDFLTPEQINSYNEHGYLMPFSGLCEREVSELRGYFDRVLEEVAAKGESSYSINTAHLKYPRIYDLMKHEAILRPVRDILGQDVVAWGAHFFCKMPRDGMRVPWHQDCIYWPLTPTRTLTVWLAIDDVDSGNAPMKFLSDSHLKGALGYTNLTEDDAVLGLETQIGEFINTQETEVCLKAGDFSIHNDLLVHGSEANQSDRRRCGLTIRYAASSVRAGFGWNAKGILVSGNDPDGHWFNLERPSA